MVYDHGSLDKIIDQDNLCQLLLRGEQCTSCMSWLIAMRPNQQVFFCRGYYADVTFVSESTYMQVEEG